MYENNIKSHDKGVNGYVFSLVIAHNFRTLNCKNLINDFAVQKKKSL